MSSGEMASFGGMTSVRGQEMMGHLPAYYGGSRIMRSVIDSQGMELDQLRAALDGILQQYYVATATWGLEWWERELGLNVDTAKPVEQRRSVILSKLRGIGSVTAELLQSMAEAYDGGMVEVAAEPGQYRFTVKFVDTLGVPPNLADLQAVIEEIKPAHLAVDYEFTYFLYSALAGSGKTYGDLTGYTYDEILNKGLT